MDGGWWEVGCRQGEEALGVGRRLGGVTDNLRVSAGYQECSDFKFAPFKM